MLEGELGLIGNAATSGLPREALQAMSRRTEDFAELEKLAERLLASNLDLEAHRLRFLRIAGVGDEGHFRCRLPKRRSGSSSHEHEEDEERFQGMPVRKVGSSHRGPACFTR